MPQAPGRSVASAGWRNSLYLGTRITKSARVYSFITITIVEKDVWEAKEGRGVATSERKVGEVKVRVRLGKVKEVAYRTSKELVFVCALSPRTSYKS